MADQNTPGVIAQARAQAPVAQPAQQQPVAPAAPVQPVADPTGQGFGGVQPNGFAQQQPIQPIEPIAQPQQAIATDNERTREQFQKILESNQRIAQQNDQLRQDLLNMQKTRQQNNQQFAPVQQPAPQQGQPVTPKMPNLSDYVEIDPVTGERVVNEQKFNAAVADVVQRASRAEEMVQNYIRQTEQREVERNEREAFAVYPQLNPQTQTFDVQFAKQTRAFVYDSLVNPQDYGGRPLSFKEAADYARSGFVAPQPSTPAVATPQVNEQNQTQKEQAAASFQSMPQQVTQNIDQDRAYGQLVQGTRLGADDALAIRIKNSAHRIDETA